MRLFASNARIVLSAAAAAVVVAASGSAEAGNAQHPRTPVEWDDVPCMEFVDRSVETNYDFVYGIPFEDTEISDEEVENSRTHQFFALCRQSSPETGLPGWITMTDVEQAMLNYDELATPPAGDILELASEWDGCWHRISEDADRRPITDAAASQPVVWDTAAVTAGVYILWGYTYEPIFNLWAPRAGGVVRVHDGGDPAASGPAAAITSREQAPCVGDTVPIEGCVDALPGTTMTAYYALAGGDEEWTPFVENVPVEGASFTLDWQAPAEAAGGAALIRVDFTDPNGVTYAAYQYERNVVLAEDSAGCVADTDDCSVAFVMDPACETTDDGSTTDAETDSGTSSAEGSRSDGCGCRSQDEPSPLWSILGLFGLYARRRPARLGSAGHAGIQNTSGEHGIVRDSIGED